MEKEGIVEELRCMKSGRRDGHERLMIALALRRACIYRPSRNQLNASPVTSSHPGAW